MRKPALTTVFIGATAMVTLPLATFFAVGLAEHWSLNITTCTPIGFYQRGPRPLHLKDGDQVYFCPPVHERLPMSFTGPSAIVDAAPKRGTARLCMRFPVSRDHPFWLIVITDSDRSRSLEAHAPESRIMRGQKTRVVIFLVASSLFEWYVAPSTLAELMPLKGGDHPMNLMDTIGARWVCERTG